MHDLAAQPLLTAEFLAVDTETNGLGKDLCELTEVGAVLVGGGELHDRWNSLVGVSQPLTRGIQRFTGISQAMVDAAPPPERVLPELAARMRGRVLVAHNARFDARVLRQAFDRAALTWPDPPILCTVALARRVAPLQRRRGLAALADALGIEVEGVHRALPDAVTCARVFCALFAKLSANAGTIGEAVALLSARRAASARPRTKPAKRPRHTRPDISGLPKDPGVYVFRNADGRPLYVGKSVCLRTRARAHFTTPGEWTGQAEHVDYQSTHSELGALVLENRLIKALRPPGNKRLKKTPDGYVYLRCRFDIPFPILEVAPEPAAGQPARRARARRAGLRALPARHRVPDPGGGAGARGRARRVHRPGAGARGGGGAGRAAQLAVRPAPLRPQAAPALRPVRVRADGALPVALPRRPGPEPRSRATGGRAAAVPGRA
ncbi:MAG: polymerase subunit epsilon, partial [Solirubrobacteraceae bacterium]|nr:polymerase subunit epsilon [Solirubrobacteraceae bacterium]